jgi:undecaprenyl phosphate N,N'-diacetylbacillosamine 1-phosphate transferase
MYQFFFKRLIDFIGSFILLIFFSPIIFITILLLLIINRGEPFFIQLRPGYKAKPFKIIKFKTMRDLMDENGILLPDEKRLTKIGKLVRSLSIDELLQLINILKGEMSLVGPRPLLTQYLPLYNSFQLRRHNVKPGITGLAQVNGRNSINWEEKFKFDIQYVDNISLILDIKILFLTIINVISRKNINNIDNLPMKEFKGTIE